MDCHQNASFCQSLTYNITKFHNPCPRHTDKLHTDVWDTHTHIHTQTSYTHTFVIHTHTSIHRQVTHTRLWYTHTHRQVTHRRLWYTHTHPHTEKLHTDVWDILLFTVFVLRGARGKYVGAGTFPVLTGWLLCWVSMPTEQWCFLHSSQSVCGTEPAS